MEFSVRNTFVKYEEKFLSKIEQNAYTIHHQINQKTYKIDVFWYMWWWIAYDFLSIFENFYCHVFSKTLRTKILKKKLVIKMMFSFRNTFVKHGETFVLKLDKINIVKKVNSKKTFCFKMTSQKTFSADNFHIGAKRRIQ